MVGVVWCFADICVWCFGFALLGVLDFGGLLDFDWCGFGIVLFGLLGVGLYGCYLFVLGLICVLVW